MAENEKFNLDGNYVFGHLSEFTGYIGEQELGSPLRKNNGVWVRNHLMISFFTQNQ